MWWDLRFCIISVSLFLISEQLDFWCLCTDWNRNFCFLLMPAARTTSVLGSRISEWHCLCWSRYISGRIWPRANISILHFDCFLVNHSVHSQACSSVKVILYLSKANLNIVNPFFSLCTHCYPCPIIILTEQQRLAPFRKSQSECCRKRNTSLEDGIIWKCVNRREF